MDIGIPKDWIEVQNEIVQAMLSTLDHTRTAFANGEEYKVRGDDDVCLMHVDGKWYARPDIVTG